MKELRIKEVLAELNRKIDRKAIADKAGIGVYHLNNAIAHNVKLAKLSDGRYIIKRNDATILDFEE